MNDNEKKLNALMEENPFTSSSVGDPWEDKYPDVQSVNERAFREVTQLIDQKTRTASLSCAGLVFGEVGSGKTHLVGRILKHGRQTEFPFSFAYVQPIEDTEQTYRYLLREVIVNLCYPIDSSSHTTQLDRILNRILEEVSQEDPPSENKGLGLRGFKELGIRGLRELKTELKKSSSFNELLNSSIRSFGKIFMEATEKSPSSANGLERRAIDAMRVKFPDIPKDFLKVLFHYQTPKRRSAATDWLKGVAIDDEDAALLGVTDRMNDSVGTLEQKSRNILTYLGILLLSYGQPLVICFDRLENYDTDEKIRSLGKMVEFLVDRAKAMLPVVFVRGQQWEENFTKKLNQQVITRLRTNEFQLKGCDHAQAMEMIKTRLATVYGNPKFGIERSQEADDFFPFEMESLKSMFKMRLHSPRQVIMLANQRMRQILYPDKEPVAPVLPLDKLQDEFEHQHTLIRADFNRYQPDRSRLKRALELYLRHSASQSDFEVELLSPHEDKHVDFECRIKRQGAETADPSESHTVFIIDTELNNSYVRASIKRGIESLEKNDGKAVYIRDARCAIPSPPKWKTTNEMLDQFKQLGGRIISLADEDAARWYALSLLNYAVKEGDVTVVDENNRTRPVSADELATFVRERIHGGRMASGFQEIGEILRKSVVSDQ